MLPVLELVPVAVDDVGAGDENLVVVCYEFDLREWSTDRSRPVRTER
jgi:microcompartment protein CcmK/EutM